MHACVRACVCVVCVRAWVRAYMCACVCVVCVCGVYVCVHIYINCTCDGQSYHPLPLFPLSPSRLDYSITGGNTADTFSVTASGGQLVLDGGLNFDTQALFPLTVSATSLTDACHCAQLRINVQVLRNRIEFMSLEEVAVSEFVSIGYDVITIQANGGVGSIQYSLEGGNTMNKFRIDSDTGIVEVNAKLDFETEQQYNLIIRAVSVGTNVDGSVTLVVNIVDENEPPVFTLPCAASVDGCSTVVVEEEMAGSTVLSVTADDPDLSSRANGMLQFSILEANSVPFSINSMGTITNAEKLDRETEDFYMFTVIVRDMGSPSLHKTSVVRVTVEDIDDNAPMFQLHPPLSVEENSRDGLFIYQFVVTDADSGSNAMFGFTLSSSDSVPFTLSPGGGILSVSGSIDYESTTSYSLDITAETPGSHSTTITAVVSVIDLNDNIPMFSGAPYRESVEEHSPLQTSIVTILATDADSGSNADITYSIFSGNIQQLLEVNTSSGVISVSGDIDRERLASFSLIVQASDAGDPSRSSTAEVVITVDDINDNAPEFNPSSYSADVREDTPTATPFTILTVFASDADVPGTLNSAIIYSIAPGSDNVTFSLNASSGEFRLEEPLDFEITQSYRINIIATDGGNPAMSTSAVVDIRVVNINEDPPVLSGDRTVNVSELSHVTSTVDRFTAFDPDNGTVTFTFTFGNSEGKFSIGESSGSITLVTTLDFESTRQYVLEITASDGGLSTSATLTVNVIDENEFAPIFTGTLSFQTDEEQSETIPIGTLQATDADGSEPNSLVTYSFGLNEILSQYFTLDSFSGEIRPLFRLDREMLTDVFPPSQNSSRSAVVIARDGGTPSLQSRDTVTIQLLDINDNTPIFSTDPIHGSVVEHSSLHTPIVTILATDADLGSNAEITYSIIGGNTQQMVELNLNSGVISVSGDIDRERLASFSLTVQASDAGDPSRSATAEVVITVDDINDNAPEFNPSSYSADVREDTPTATPFTILTVFASDADGPGTLNSAIIYSIAPGSDDVTFSLNASSGEFRLEQPLDFEVTQSYRINIIATDRGNPAMSSSAVVDIRVVNINEDPPVLSGDRTVNVSELAPISSIVARFTALDPDHFNVTFTFSFGNSEGKFSIGESSGTITLVTTLDFESTRQYVLEITASDGGQSTSATLTVNVIDENEFAPIFTGTLSFQTDEEQSETIPVGTLQATDADGSEPNSLVTYSFGLNEILSQYFTLDSFSGEIRPLFRLNREMLTDVFPPSQNSSRSAVVIARDGGTPSLQSRDTVTIQLLDINDNTPIFSTDPIHGSVVEHSSLHTPIVTILATDADLGSNAEITYSIIGGNTQQMVELNLNSGVISVSGDIDRERLASFSLTVQAIDAGDPSRFSTAEVVITVDDINDNAPEFNPSSYSANVSEDSTPFTILMVSAFDDDAPGTLNSAICYNIASDDGTFSLDASSGEFRLEQPLDFEVTQSYRIDVIATDKGNPAMSSSAVVDIRIVNINEDPPVLSGDRTVNVSELAPVSFIVDRFTAFDPDNGIVTFTFSFGNSEGKFSIGESSGTITLVTTLDFESTRQYVLEITASDGGLSTSATLTVNVIDENEFAPIFTGTLSFQTDEEQSETIPVGTLQATDADGSEPNSLVTYSFGLNEILLSQYFTLDSFSGEIRPLFRLDREMLTHVFPPSQNSSRSAEVIARDGGTPSLQSRDTITIQLLDINDNAPIFTQNSYINSLHENLPANTTVFQLSATDADLGSNAAIGFSFTETGGNEGLFSLDPMTGLMITTQTLDCEFATDYMFSFVAKDLGTPAMSSSVGGRLDIIDENDNSPIFDQSVYDLTVFENFTVGHDVLVVLATDADKGTNGEVSYELIGQVIDDSGENPEEATILVISSTSGIVKHNTPFNFENDPLINLTLLALDMGIPRRTGTAQLSITVVNVDEEAPNFADSCNAPVYAYEDILIGAVVTRCIATDKDNISTEANRDRAIIYSVVDGTGTFSVRETTGEVILAKELDREAQASYEVSVIATDLAGRSTRISLQVIVRDINDNAPTFLEPSYSDTLTDMAILSGQNELLTVVAEDRDEHLAGSVLYAITDVTVSENLLGASIMVIATDQGTPSLNSTVVVMVVFDSPCLIQQYFIGRQTGTLSASLLCSVTISPPSMALPEGSQHLFTCNVLSNTALSVSFIRDGSRVSPEGTSTTHSIGAARQADTGDYTCSAHSNSLPSLQSTTSRLTVTSQSGWEEGRRTRYDSSPLSRFLSLPPSLPLQPFPQ